MLVLFLVKFVCFKLFLFLIWFKYVFIVFFCLVVVIFFINGCLGVKMVYVVLNSVLGCVVNIVNVFLYLLIVKCMWVFLEWLI